MNVGHALILWYCTFDWLQYYSAWHFRIQILNNNTTIKEKERRQQNQGDRIRMGVKKIRIPMWAYHSNSIMAWVNRFHLNGSRGNCPNPMCHWLAHYDEQYSAIISFFLQWYRTCTDVHLTWNTYSSCSGKNN
jgi:hypothetical protein